MRKGLIFDLDGTLWNPVKVILRAWEETLNSYKELGVSVTQGDLEGVFGMQDTLIAKKLFPNMKKGIRESMVNKCFNRENDFIKIYGGDLYPRLEWTLQKLIKDYDLYIVSNCQKGYIEAFFSYHKLEKYFIDFECSGNTGNPKGDNIRAIIERNSIHSPVYIGDTDGDKKGAKENGIPFIYASYGFARVDEYKFKIEQISDLPKLLSVAI